MESTNNKSLPPTPVDNPPVYEAEPKSTDKNKSIQADGHGNPPPIRPLPNVAPEVNQSAIRRAQLVPDITDNITQLDRPAKIVPVPEAHKVTPLNRLGESPEWIDCPWCQRMTKTRVSKLDSDNTTLAALVCCLSCGICCLCLPCLMGYAQDTAHHCTNCNNKVTHKPHDGPIQVLAPKSTGKVVSQYAPVGVIHAPDRAQVRRV